jgi:uroporphyrinogen-III synthase
MALRRKNTTTVRRNFPQVSSCYDFGSHEFFRMTKPLEGVRVAITENRFPEQLTQLLERYGADVYSCPLLRETPIEDIENSRQFIRLCETTKIDYIVFYTGVGVDFLFRITNKPEVFSRSKTIARGPKAVNALRKNGVQVDFVADSPTTAGILQTLSREELRGKSVLVQLYGEENVELRRVLESKGATVTGLSLYRYEQASDAGAVAKLVRAIALGKIQAITFTTGAQARFLLQAAEEQGSRSTLIDHFAEDVVVVSIGEITARVLRGLGIEPKVIPEEPKMGPMVKALADFFEKRKR